MDELEVYKQTMSRQAQRIGALTLDLDLAHTQIDLLNEQLKAVENPETKTDNQKG